jgi:hypothetical protein
MAAPNTQNTGHPIGGGQSPSYLGGPGGEIGFFQDPYGAQFLATINGTVMTVLQLVNGTIVPGQELTNAGGAPVTTPGVIIVSRGTATAQDGPGALGTYNLSASLTYANATLFQSAGGAALQPSGFNRAPSINANLANANAMYSATSAAAIVKYQTQAISNAVNGSTANAQTTSVTTQLQLTGSMFTPPPQSTTPSVFVANKPSHQAGLGIGSVRCQTTGIYTMEYVNVCATTAITPTATDVYDIIEFKQSPLTATATVTAPLLLPQSTNEVVVTVGTGIALPGYAVVVNKPTAQTTAGSPVVVPAMAARVVGVNQVAITMGNCATTAAGVTPTSEAYNFAFVPQINATNPLIVYGCPAAQAAVTASSLVETSAAVTGTVLTDIVIGVQRNSTAISVSSSVLSVGRVTSANSITMTYANVASTGSFTDTTTGIYPVTLLRQNALNPVQMYYPLLNATTCAATTTIEATTTVTGLIVSSSVIVNKPTYTPGLVVLNARVSAANTLAVTYGNFTTNSISVPAEVYTVANVQLQGPGTGVTVTAGNFVGVTYNPGLQESIRNAQALRNSLVALNLIAPV